MSSPRYWREIPQRYRLEAGKCKKCGKVFFPPRLICDACKSREFEKIILQKEGKLLTFTVIRVAPTEFTDQVPYAMGIVELNEGVKILTQIADCDFDKLEIGMPLRIEFRKISQEGEAGIICYGYKCVPV
ncbi:MAG: Zn-ribbon domain-containing OB-fold protein [candidate division Zixibacteria bacterium]|nr:Zn-ribbon domain-containing OB-fold protein [candidate division Zixibacteria bacterium]